MSPVEAFVTGTKMFDRQKNRLIIPFKALYRLIFTGQRSNQLSKRVLINVDPCHKRFYTEDISDYPL